MKQFDVPQMRTAISKILEKRGLLSEFERDKDFHTKIESSGFMPLIIERQHNRLVIAHYYEQNGDLIADPDLVLSLTGTDLWIPIELQTPYSYTSALSDSSEELDRTTIRGLIRFTNFWAANLNMQFG